MTTWRRARPFGAARKRARVGKTTLRFPVTFVANVRRMLTSSSMPAPIPAFEKTSSSGAWASQALTQARTAASSATSSTSARTSAPSARQRTATPSRRPASRPHRNRRFAPRRAHSSASASPIPLEAPVIRMLSAYFIADIIAHPPYQNRHFAGKRRTFSTCWISGGSGWSGVP